MPGLVPGIHVLLSRGAKNVDGRDKPGHDDFTSGVKLSALLAQPHDHVDAGDLVAIRHFRHLREHEVRIGNVD